MLPSTANCQNHGSPSSATRLPDPTPPKQRPEKSSHGTSSGRFHARHNQPSARPERFAVHDELFPIADSLPFDDFLCAICEEECVCPTSLARKSSDRTTGHSSRGTETSCPRNGPEQREKVTAQQHCTKPREVWVDSAQEGTNTRVDSAAVAHGNETDGEGHPEESQHHTSPRTTPKLRRCSAYLSEPLPKSRLSKAVYVVPMAHYLRERIRCKRRHCRQLRASASDIQTIQQLEQRRANKATRESRSYSLSAKDECSLSTVNALESTATCSDRDRSVPAKPIAYISPAKLLLVKHGSHKKSTKPAPSPLSLSVFRATEDAQFPSSTKKGAHSVAQRMERLAAMCDEPHPNAFHGKVGRRQYPSYANQHHRQRLAPPRLPTIRSGQVETCSQHATQDPSSPLAQLHSRAVDCTYNVSLAESELHVRHSPSPPIQRRVRGAPRFSDDFSPRRFDDCWPIGSSRSKRHRSAPSPSPTCLTHRSRNGSATRESDPRQCMPCSSPPPQRPHTAEPAVRARVDTAVDDAGDSDTIVASIPIPSPKRQARGRSMSVDVAGPAVSHVPPAPSHSRSGRQRANSHSLHPTTAPHMTASSAEPRKHEWSCHGRPSSRGQSRDMPLSNFFSHTGNYQE